MGDGRADRGFPFSKRRPSVTHLIPLTGATDAERVGGKARGLNRLIAAGFRVPDGYVVPADVDGQMLRTLLDGTLGEGTYAYRSSSTAEDLATASFAGQYETILGVTDAEAGVKAVERVRSSARSEAAESYRYRSSQGNPQMAVIVQRQLEARVSGVAFTRNPVTGANEIVIEATQGIGEALLSGAVKPEAWVVSATPTLTAPSTEPVLTAEEARLLADLCRRVESALDGPQDVEWAIDDDGVWLLQARPITALPIEPTHRPNPKTSWERSDAFFPYPITPLVYTAWMPTHTAATRKALELLGIPANGIAHGYFYGRVYDRIVPLVGGESDARGLPPVPIMRLMIRLHPGFRVRLRGAAEAARTDLPIRFIHAWEHGSRDRIRSRTRQLRSVDLSGLTDEELAEHLAEVRAHAYACGLEHFKLVFGGWVLLGQLGMAAEHLAGWKPDRVIDLVQGHGEATRAEGEALSRVARAVESDPVARALLEEGGDLRDHEGTAGTALRAFLEEYGHRVHDSFLRPTWAEDPAPVLSLLRSHVASQGGSSPRSKPATDGVVAELLDQVSEPSDRARLKEAVLRAQKGRPYGDETERDANEAIGLMRRVALEAGSRFVEQRRLEARNDVVFLEIDELASALGGAPIDRALIDRRRAEHRWALANPSPPRLGPEGGHVPGPEVFPTSAQPVVGAFMWATGHLFFTTPETPVDGSLRGLGASPGIAEGPARVIRGHADFDRIRNGDIVVCPSTMASWSSIFSVISGLVTEVGGPLSHPGTLAREYGLPAVLGVPEATALIQDGGHIRIDGATGTVTALDSPIRSQVGES